MKRYIYTLIVGALLSLTACVMEDPLMDGGNFAPTPGNGGLHIVGSAENFDKVNVGTRAEDTQYPDLYISEMTMFIFKQNGDLLQGYDANKNPISSAINLQLSNPTFLIEAKKYNGTGIISSVGASINIKYFDNTANDLGACSIYIVANAYHQLKHLIDGDDSNGEIKKLDDLNHAVLDIDTTLAMPKMENGTVIGFPMIGAAENADKTLATFDLKYSTNTSSNAVANIPLKKIYSKVQFIMQVNSNQVVKDGPTPKFTLEKVEVFNIPTKAHMGYVAGDYAEKIEQNLNLTEANIADYYHFNSVNGTPFELPLPDVRTIYNTTSETDTESVLEFGFYMPEHMLSPNPITYPAGIPEDLKQYYKPKGVAAGSDGTGLATAAKIATFVRIHGSYTDHNGQIKGVSYDIYLGQDETDDFEIKRNQQLNNYVTITGLTNHKDAYFGEGDNISIDHRVTMTEQGYNIYMEREATLDSHFEVRPLDIELQKGASMTIVIPEEYRSWIAMEDDRKASSGVNSNLYIDNSENSKRGVRKYFTTGLVSELNNANGGKITISHSGNAGGDGKNKNTEYFRIWFYIDENPNVYDDSLPKNVDYSNNTATANGITYNISRNEYRKALVNFYYAGNATDTPNTNGTPASVINFQQWNLWRVWNSDGNRYYDIEHEEEYLNNYASNLDYGKTQDGMPWGLENVQLSYNYPSLVVKQNIKGIGATIIEIIKSWFQLESMADLANKVFADGDQAIHYDFYLSRDITTLMSGVGGDSSDITNKLTVRDYSGLDMNKKIANVLKEKYPNAQLEGRNDKETIDRLQLSDQPKSAFAYCYNKNKRNDDGTIDTNSITWHLPAIDEIEDIAAGAYDEFNKVFQNKRYWSCQSAYELRAMDISILQKKLLSSGYNTEGSLTGNYFIDDKDRARATSVVVSVDTNGEQKINNIPSNAPRSSGTQKGQAVFNWTLTEYDEKNSKLTDFNPANPAISESDFESVKGNMLRTEKARIRAVYRSGQGTIPSGN